MHEKTIRAAAFFVNEVYGFEWLGMAVAADEVKGEKKTTLNSGFEGQLLYQETDELTWLLAMAGVGRLCDRCPI